MHSIGNMDGQNSHCFIFKSNVCYINIPFLDSKAQYDNFSHLFSTFITLTPPTQQWLRQHSGPMNAFQGRIQDFHLGGGGGGAQKIMCPHEHYERGTELTFGRGPGPA